MPPHHPSIPRELLEYVSSDSEGEEGEGREEAPQQQRLLSDPSTVNPEELQGEIEKSLAVDGVPATTADKISKLKDKLREIFSQFGNVTYLEVPTDATSGNGLGFAFVAYDARESAKSAIETLTGFKFGKDTLKVYPFSYLEKFAKVPDVFVPPSTTAPPPAPTPSSAGASAPHYLSWLQDGRDQFVVRQGTDTIINWVGPLAQNADVERCYAGERETRDGRAWCRKYVHWSPQGTYLLTMHQPGLKVWGGPAFTNPPTGKFPQPDCDHHLFSPCERYLFTWDGTESNEIESLFVWSVKSGRRLRGFKVAPGSTWPVMKWNANGSHFARTIENGVSLFETPSMKLADRPMPARGIVTFEWSPSDAEVLAFWAPEQGGNIPARVAVVNPISKKELRSKNLFNVESVKLVWHPKGDFLCALVTRHSKTGKTTFATLEIFRMRDDGIPGEMIELKEGKVESFAFEPNGTRFGYVLVNPAGRTTVHFYDLVAAKKGDKLISIVALENKACNQLFWSPNGAICVLAGLGEMNGKLEFYDVEEKLTLNTAEHFMCNEVLWDPTGRLVATCATQPLFSQTPFRSTLEVGYKFFSPLGQKLREFQEKEFYSFSWRPRPSNFLSKDEVDEIKRKLPNFTKRYDREDDLIRKQKAAAENEAKIKMLIEFRGMMKQRRADAEREDEARRARGLPRLLATRAETEQDTEIVETVEEIISEKVERL